jgi:hypothetical protein
MRPFCVSIVLLPRCMKPQCSISLLRAFLTNGLCQRNADAGDRGLYFDYTQDRFGVAHKMRVYGREAAAGGCPATRMVGDGSRMDFRFANSGGYIVK